MKITTKRKIPAPKAVNKGHKKLIYLKYNEPPVEIVDRSVPSPNRAAAPTTGKILLEHAYWLGEAIHNGDGRTAQHEINVIAKLARMYRTLASSPAGQPLKFSSSDNYPANARKKPGGKKAEHEDSDEDNEQEVAHD